MPIIRILQDFVPFLGIFFVSYLGIATPVFGQTSK